MRLKCIKLAGFKSFVDPTTIDFPSNLCAVVGPNGCGKSNVIDAVRWVLGESSPRNLRGEQMSDVIFSGSEGRHPVGLASVELVFDNADQRLRGEYAGYREISVKRKVERGGDSVYSLNGVKCRRKDITEQFLGTGLGPRSYSIVEQGLTDRLIESRPEELRLLIDEAAGVSKYRASLKETDALHEKTRANLERSADVRDELQRQLQHLEKQSRQARRYRELMREQRAVEAQKHALEWRGLAEEMQAAKRGLAALEKRREEIDADARAEEAAIVLDRARREELQSGVADIRDESVRAGNDIARLEQSIEHQRKEVEQIEVDLKKTRGEWRQSKDELDDDLARVTRKQADLKRIEDQLKAAREKELRSSSLAAETERRQREEDEQQWDEFNLEAETPQQTVKVEQNRIQQYQESIRRAEEAREPLQAELARLDAAPVRSGAGDQQALELTRELEQARGRHGAAMARMAETRKAHETCVEALDGLQADLQQIRGRKASLDALQQAALGGGDEDLSGWLKRHGLDRRAKLGEILRIEPGWETAVELVLGIRLGGVLVDELPASLPTDQPDAELILLDAGESKTTGPGAARRLAGLAPLVGKVAAGRSVEHLLRDVYSTENPAAALAARAKLPPGASVVTADGFWVGDGWVRVGKADGEQSVVLRQGLIESLGSEIERIEVETAKLAARRDELRRSLDDVETEREACLERIQEKNAALNRVRAEIAAEKSRFEENLERRGRIEAELTKLLAQIEQDQAAAEKSGLLLGEARERAAADAGRQAEYARLRKENRQQLEAQRALAAEDRKQLQELTLKQNELETQVESTRKNMDRMALQERRAREHIEELETRLEQARLPGGQLRRQLEQKLAAQADIERELTAAQTALTEADANLHSREQTSKQLREDFNAIVEEIAQHRVENEGAAVKSGQLLDRLRKSGLSPERVLEELPEDRTAASCGELLSKLEARIQRMGPVNLVAAEELKELAERKAREDKIRDQLERALAKQQEAKNEFESEIRSGFSATMNDINTGLKELFPRLFGGGQAFLETIGGDLLNAGVAIMARPPGKKNVGIHLLSGGEKAMTAIAVIFTIFRLNPSPFCMLDEVDAPLDETNTSRFTALLRDLAETVQFILVTHNKVSMEAANQLLGVTMREAGVSRVVSVDIDEAAEMAGD